MRNILNAGAIALVLGVTATAASADMNFVFGNYSSPTATLNAAGILPWLDAVEKESGGKIKTKFIGGGSVVTAKTGLSTMRDGLVDGDFISIIYLPAETPVNSIFVNLGAKLGNTMAAGGALMETVMFDCPACLAEMKRWNVQPLGSWSTPAYSLLCLEPKKSLADFKGARIRASGYTVGLTAALGATPVNMTVTDVYEALQHNQVDCTFGSAGWLESYSLGESAKYVVDVKAGGVASPILVDIRRDLWETLTPAEKKVFVDTAPIAMAGATWGYINEESKALGMTDKGYKLVEPDADVLAALEAEGENQAKVAVQKAEAKGVKNAQEIADKFLANYAKWEKLTADVHSQKAYADLLRKEIYSRYPMN